MRSPVSRGQRLRRFQSGEQIGKQLVDVVDLKVAILMVRHEGAAPGCGSRRA